MAAYGLRVRTFLAPKVPAVLLFFWVTKLLTTGIGEAAADYLAFRSKAVFALVSLVGFGVALWWQLRADRYHPVRYWLAVLMVAVFGTAIADGPHQVLGMPYWMTSAGCFVALAAVLGWWYRSEGTLSVHSIVTSTREVYYWITVLLTFGLGTALGDLTASTFSLGYAGSIVVFGVLILVPLALWRAGAGAVACFWAAYVLTRPLGASIADWLGKPTAGAKVAAGSAHAGTGLGWGDDTVTVIGLVLFVALVAYAAVTHSDEDHAAMHAELAPVEA